jgi:hypothetical protein
MGFGLRTGKPPDSGESAAADLKEQWNLRAHNSLARRWGGPDDQWVEAPGRRYA